METMAKRFLGLERSEWGFWGLWTLINTVAWPWALVQTGARAWAGAGAGIAVGVALWVALRKRLRRSGWWVLASAVAWALVWTGAVIWTGLAPGVGAAAVAGVSYGAITGLVLVLLLRHPVEESSEVEEGDTRVASNKSKRRTFVIVGAGCAGAILLVCLAAGALVVWGSQVFTSQAREALNENPVIEQHVGEIDQIAIDYRATWLEEERYGYVLEVKGSKGAGVVTAVFITTDHTERITSGTLRLSSGELYDLLPAAGAP
jgi:hypothetical protein